MDTQMSDGTEYFLDTSYAIALSSKSDAWHLRALQLAGHLKESRIRLVTTRAVLLEIGNALAKQRFREGAVALLTALEGDPQVEILALTDELFQEAVELFAARPDKDWGPTDCVSFQVMHRRGIDNALTADAHFTRAGFQILLA